MSALSYGAAGAAMALEDLLKQKFFEQIQKQTLAQAAARDASAAELGRGRLQIDQGNLDLRGKEFEAATQPRAPEPLKPMTVGGRIVDPNTGKVIFEPPAEAPAAVPVIRLNPRTGKMEQMGEAPKGAHFVSEPAPQGPTHARYSISDGTDASGKPVKIRMNVDTGQIEAVPLPSGVSSPKREQPATQDQTNLAIYGKRLEQADPILKQIEKSIAGMNVLAYEAQTRADHPKLQTPEMQSYMQAARNFINAVLRRESGAVISPTEFSEARKQYLPVPGDAPQTLAQKAANRKLIYDQMRQGAGAAWREDAATGAGAGNAAAKAVELLKKYGGG